MGSIIEADHATGKWIFSKEDIEKNTPSRKDGIDAKKEAWLRKGCCTFIQDAGMRLKVPQLTIATAIMFCHRFFMRQSYAQQDRYVIASTCLFLAGKVEDTPRQLKDVIYVTYIIRHKKDKGAEDRIKQSREVFEHERELLLAGEYLVMNTLSFDLNINHPYKPLLSTIRKFDKEGPLKHLAQVSWNFVNDGLRTSLGLQFKPHEVAAGAIYLAAKFLKISLPQQDGKPWWTEFQVTPSILEDVSSQMLELYEQTKDGSGTTGASSRRHSKQAAPSKSAAGAKSKERHPATPSVADRAAQASLTSGASAPVPAAPLPLPGSSAREGDAAPAAQAANVPPAVVAAAPSVSTAAAVEQTRTGEGELGAPVGAVTRRDENGHKTAGAAGEVRVAPGEAADTGAAGDGVREASANGSRQKFGGIETAGLAEAISAQTGASKGSGGEAKEGTGISTSEHEGAKASAGPGLQGAAGGEALDEPMDVDEDTPPSAAPAAAAPPPLPRLPEQPLGAEHGVGLEPELRAGVSGAAGAPGADAGKEQGGGKAEATAQQGARSKGAGSGEGVPDRDGGEVGSAPGGTSGRQEVAPTASQGPGHAAEEGEIPSEEGEIPSSPVSHEVRSPGKASRERERGARGRSRSRSRSYSRDRTRSRSRSASPPRRRGGHLSRSRSPLESGRGRSPSSGGKRHKNGQRRRDWDKGRGSSGHRAREAGDRSQWDRDRDWGRDRDRDRNRDRDRDRERQASHRSHKDHKDSNRHRSSQNTESTDRRR